MRALVWLLNLVEIFILFYFFAEGLLDVFTESLEVTVYFLEINDSDGVTATLLFILENDSHFIEIIWCVCDDIHSDFGIFNNYQGLRTCTDPKLVDIMELGWHILKCSVGLKEVIELLRELGLSR